MGGNASRPRAGRVAMRRSPLPPGEVLAINVARASGQVRMARPTSRLEDVVAFYRDGLGPEVIDSFHDHEGFTSVMVGLPGSALHLEFTTREDDLAEPTGLAPTKDNLVVFYVAAPDEFASITEGLQSWGHSPVPPLNPYWLDVGGLTFEDPDGWRVVVVPGPYHPEQGKAATV
jgi:catechol 2,3-dioxygenase-like lactoylglutathione lyase family enzyme